MNNQSKRSNQLMQPSQDNQGQIPRSSGNLIWIIASVVVLVAVTLLLLVSQQGGYLQARVSLDNSNEEATSVDVVSPPDDYTAWEGGCAGGELEDEDCGAYEPVDEWCSGLRQGCLVECQQYSFDYQKDTCRPDCEDHFSGCLATTTADKAVQNLAPVEVEGLPDNF